MAGGGYEDDICAHSISFCCVGKGPMVLSDLVQGREEVRGTFNLRPKLNSSAADFDTLRVFGIVLSAAVCCSQDVLYS